MIAKEKAQELFDKYNLSFAGVISNEEDWEYLAKQCALIAVDECIKHEKQIVEQIKSLQLPNSFIAIINEGSFWRQVKHEIENI
jgi:hypothetical protein